MAELPSDSPSVIAAADKAYNTVATALGKKNIGFGIPQVLGGLMWALIAMQSSLRLALSFALSDVVLPVALEIIKIIVSVRESGGQEFAKVSAEIMGEFLGIEIDPGNIAPGQGPGAAATRASALGNAFLDMLEGTLQGNTPIQPVDGAVNAKRFTGYGINFATTNALMSIIAELVSDEHLTQLQELGNGVARDIGLGRLIRRAVQPLINAKIVQPYTRFVNASYRPKELAVGEILLGLHAGRITDDAATTMLSELGYSDELIIELKLQHVPRLTLTEVDSLIRWGKLDQAGGVKVLTDQGWPAELATQRLDALHLAAGDREERAYGAEIVKLAQERMIDQPTFATLIDRLHLPDEEKQGLANRVGVYLDSHHKQLTIGELLYLEERNLITGDQVLTWAEQQGYDSTGQQEIDLFVTEKILEYQAVQAAKAAKAAAAAAKKKGSVPPPKG